MWGAYQDARQFYASDEWLEIVRRSLECFEVRLKVIQGTGQDDDVKALKIQIAACKQELGLTPQRVFNYGQVPFPEVTEGKAEANEENTTA